MNPIKFSTVLSDLVESSLMDVHTCLPAKVVSVDYGTGHLSATPLVRTRVAIGKTLDYPQLDNIPMLIMSGKAGIARITFPVSAGDIVIVLFSERDSTSVISGSGSDTVDPDQSAPLGLYPIGALPCIFTSSGGSPISPTDVELKNDKSLYTLKPDGSQKISNTSGSIELGSDGTITQTAGGGKILMTPDGTVNINGFIISPSGQATSSTGVSLENHVHGGVQTGPSETSKPVV